MPDLHSLVDRMYYANRREYSARVGNVAYLDGTPLKRPISMPIRANFLLLAIVAVAVVIGLLFVNTTVLSSIREAAEAERAMTENLARQASIETIPKMSDLVGMDDSDILSQFKDNGYTIFDATDMAKSDDLIVYKLPADMTEADAGAMLANGINSLTPVQATKLLNGAWYFSAERSGATSMVVRYADFTTGNPQIAIQNAMAKQELETSTISNQGTDESGNTFSEGTIESGGKNYLWRVSALPLSEMYSITGMPEQACYVGVRITAQ